jgi:hypothetical protein
MVQLRIRLRIPRIPIEHRPPLEACLVRGRLIGSLAQAVVQVTPELDLEGGGVYNPSFDVTPASLISAVVTERGECGVKTWLDGLSFLLRGNGECAISHEHEPQTASRSRLRAMVAQREG